MTKPRIRIEFAGDAHPAYTKVFNEDGIELECVERIVLDLDVHKSEPEAIMGATIYAVDVSGTKHAQVEDLKIKILPAPLPKTTYKLSISAPKDVFRPGDPDQTLYAQSAYVLEKHEPLPTWGESTTNIASGFMSPIGPLELVFEEEA